MKACSIYSPNGNGQLGHAILILGQVAYNNMATTGNPAGVAANAFDWQPLFPPPMEPVITANATQNAIAGAIMDWERQTKMYTMYNNIEHALKQQLLSAIDNTFVCSLRDNLAGYAHITTFQILEHLTATYGTLNKMQLIKNLNTLTQPWEPTDSMEPLWQRCLDCQQIAAAGNDPIMDIMLIRLMQSLLKNTGFFVLDIREWDRKPLAEQTWANFKVLFTQANKDRCDNLTADKLQHHGFFAIGDCPGTPSMAKLLPSRASTSPLTCDTKGTHSIVGPTVLERMKTTPALHVSTRKPGIRKMRPPKT